MKTLSTPSPHIQAFVDGSIGWLVLDRPERHNALNAAMWAAIPPSMKSLDEEVDVQVIVLRGAGERAFAAGADIAEFARARGGAQAAAEYERLNGAAFAAIRAAAKPVLAMIGGYCFGGGLALALACDLRLADASARFSLPPARLGLAYPLDGLRDLVVAVGASAAKDMIFTARRVAADEALRLGLIDRLSSDLEADTRALAAEIAANAPLTLAHAKRAIDFVAARPDDATLIEVSALADRCFDSDDYVEGRTAFLEKRKPVFKGA